MVVVHRRISQVNASGLMNIESSNKFNRSGDTAYGCIEGINLEQYQIGIIGGQKCSCIEESKSTTLLITIIQYYDILKFISESMSLSIGYILAGCIGIYTQSI